MIPPAPAEGAGPAAKPADLADRPAASLAFSADGRYLAACTAGLGELKTWRLDGDGMPQLIYEDPRPGPPWSASPSTAGTVVSGGSKGSVSSHRLERGGGGEQSWTVAPNRGKVLRLDSSPSRRYLLVLTDDLQAQVWDLKDRTCRGLPGSWTSAAFVDDDTLILTAAADAPAHAARLVRARRDADRNRFVLEPDYFARSLGAFKVPEKLAFEGATLSPDRTRIAARANPTQSELVCIWDVKSGKLTNWIGSLDDPAQGLSFSADGRRLLTAGDSTEASLWNLDGQKEGELKAAEVKFRDPQPGRRGSPAPRSARATTRSSPATATARSTSGAGKTGRRSWKAAGLVQGVFAGVVKALTFTADGKKLAAAGDGTSIWLGTMDDPPAAVDDLDGLRPHHTEQINAMLAWSDPPMLITGSDDTTVRFWDLKRKALWGTFSAAAMPAQAGDPANLPVVDMDWVFYTPDGFFDASAGGQKRIRFRHRDEADPAGAIREYALSLPPGGGSARRRAPAPGPGARRAAPDLDRAPRARRPDRARHGAVRHARRRRLDRRRPLSQRPADRHRARAAKKPFPEQFPVKTRLVKGTNRFHAMASRGGAV